MNHFLFYCSIVTVLLFHYSTILLFYSGLQVYSSFIPYIDKLLKDVDKLKGTLIYK